MRAVKWSHAVLASITLATFVSVTTACYGPFNLTRTIYKWNGQVKGTGDIKAKWMRELVFLGLVLLPVYEFSLIIDGLFLNSIEFWGGQNPIKATQEKGEGNTRIVRVGETTVTMTLSKDGNSADVTYAKAGKVFKTAEIVQSEDSYGFVDENGQYLYSVEIGSDGGLNLVDSECRLLQRISAQRLALGASRLASMQVVKN